MMKQFTKLSKFTFFSIALFYALILNQSFAASVVFPSAPSFGKVTVGTTKTISFTATNNTSVQVRLDSFWFKNGNPYKVVGGSCKYNQTTGFILGGLQSCTVDIKFSPSKVSLQNNTFVLGYFLGTGWTWQESNLALAGEGVSGTPTPTPSPTPLSCTFNGQTIASGSSVTAYSTSTVPYGQTCLSQTRTCANGVLSGAYAYASCSVAPAPAPAPTGWLKVQGNKIVNDQGVQVILKGVNIADPQHLDTKQNERPGVTARSVASSATDQYFAEVIRLPILPGDPNYPNEGWFSPTTGGDKYFNNHILPLVNELTSKGIYVIIDLHYISNYQDLYPKVSAFWKYMAPKFKDNPRVIYEIMNEPILPDNWTTWKNTIAQPATDLIRSYAPNNLIFVGGPYWSSHMAGAATNPVVGNNIVYIGHVYSNQSSTMWNQQYLPVLQKYPFFITEWGFEQGGTEGGTITYGQAFETWMRIYNVGWTVWSFDVRWGPRMFNTDWSLKPSPGGMGIFVRDLLIEQHLK